MNGKAPEQGYEGRMVQHVDKAVPRPRMSYLERVLEQPLLLRAERAVEVPQVLVQSDQSLSSVWWQSIGQAGIGQASSSESSGQMVPVPTFCWIT